MASVLHFQALASISGPGSVLLLCGAILVSFSQHWLNSFSQHWLKFIVSTDIWLICSILGALFHF